MKTHYSEADLLEMHYLKPCMNTAMLAHVESCGECTAKLQRLEEKLRSVECETPQMPETFWQRQRLSILRRAEGHQAKSTAARVLRVAAAAALAFFLGGVVMYRAIEPAAKAPAVTATHSTTATVASTAPAATDDPQILRDPWQSDELNDFHTVVKWESWIDAKNGGQL